MPIVPLQFSEPQSNRNERDAFVGLNPSGFFIRHPPAPHELNAFITTEDQLFQTIHMGAAVVDTHQWILLVDGLVERPFVLTLRELEQLPQRSINAFHECYGSPVKPPTQALWRIGNVEWTGIPLHFLLEYARPLPQARYVWSEGLDRGEFAGVKADRYQKDLPLEKALCPEVLIAYQMNGQPLGKERGGPVRLVVPGWFGTNSTKWLSRLSVQADRAPGPFTTTFYNEKDPTNLAGPMRPVYRVEPNSMIVKPTPGAVVHGPELDVEGWAWSDDGIEFVDISTDGGQSWLETCVKPRVDFSWQKFLVTLHMEDGSHTLMARATSRNGIRQPLTGRRNHVHSITVSINR